MEARQTHELRNRALFTVLVLAAYLLCRSISLYGVSAGDPAAQGASGQLFLMTLLSGDRYRETVMALGIAPYINASLAVQVVFAFRNAASRARVSKMESERWMLWISIVFGAVMAVMQSFELTFRADAGPVWAVRLVVIIEMLAGALLTSFLCAQNEKRGIGASMPIILINIVGPLVRGMSANHFFDYPLLVLLCLVTIGGTVYMENSLIRLPLQRVSIHNVHADQNYLAYKRAPMGIMPVMFASSAFLLPYFLVRILASAFPGNESLAYVSANMELTRPLGAVVLLALIIVLSLLFSLLMLNPKETAHQLQRNGDSIIGMYAGRETKSYLTRLVVKWGLFSGVLQAACMAASLFLSLEGTIPMALAMTPSSMMILVSIVCSLVQEIGTYHRYDAYRFFM
jgi:preprotein translocase subunit SecY